MVMSVIYEEIRVDCLSSQLNCDRNAEKGKRTSGDQSIFIGRSPLVGSAVRQIPWANESLGTSFPHRRGWTWFNLSERLVNNYEASS
jgi:hypothetical protein